MFVLLLSMFHYISLLRLWFGISRIIFVFLCCPCNWPSVCFSTILLYKKLIIIIMWNQQVQTDRTIPKNKPDIKIRDNEKETFLSPEIATSINIHVSFSLSLIIMSVLLLGIFLSVCTCWFQNMVTLPPWFVSTVIIIIIIIYIKIPTNCTLL